MLVVLAGLNYAAHTPARRLFRLFSYAVALARLNAVAGPDDVGAPPRWSVPTSRDVDSFLTLAKEFGEAVPPHLSTELNELVQRLARTEKEGIEQPESTPKVFARRSYANQFFDAAWIQTFGFEEIHCFRSPHKITRAWKRAA